MYLPDFADRYCPVLPLGTDWRMVLFGCRAAVDAFTNFPLDAER